MNIRGESTRLPEPIPSRKVWTAALREMKGDLKISLNEDGTVAALRLSAVVEDMVLTQRQLKMLRPGAGDSPENPVEIVFMFDGFPVERISVEHFCVGTASLRDDFSSQSEQLLRVINCSKIKENNPSLRRVAEYNSMGRDFNELVRVRGFKPTAPVEENDYPPFVHVEMLVAADKKGVEVHRGCSPCCAWCTCSDVQRLKLPWDPSTPPLTWASAEILLNQVCKRPFPSIPLIFEAAHVALPGEELPRHCRWCKKLPFASVAEYSAAMQRWSTMRADVSREGKKKFLKERSAHASTHISQYPFEFPAFLVGMDKVIPETLHIYDLNIDKQIYKQGIRRHLDEYTAGRVTDFFSGMGAPLNQQRADGTKDEKWWKAAFRAGMILGNAKFPGGVAAWLPSLVLLIGKCRLEQRDKARGGGDGVDVSGAAASSASDSSIPLSLQHLVFGKYGKSLGQTLLLMLQGYDAYRKLRELIDRRPAGDSTSDKQSLALMKACAGVVHACAQPPRIDTRHEPTPPATPPCTIAPLTPLLSRDGSCRGHAAF